MRNIFEIYDFRFLVTLGLTYFNQGFKIFTRLAVMDLFRNHLHLEPSYTQYLGSIITLPWTFKLLYGLIADNIPIGGSRRKRYVVLSGFGQFLSLIVLSFGVLDNAGAITGLLFINSLFIAMTDVVIDAIMVAQSRRDPIHGSENLQSYSWIMLSIGGIFGSIMAGYFTENL